MLSHVLKKIVDMSKKASKQISGRFKLITRFSEKHGKNKKTAIGPLPSAQTRHGNTTC